MSLHLAPLHQGPYQSLIRTTTSLPLDGDHVFSRHRDVSLNTQLPQCRPCSRLHRYGEEPVPACCSTGRQWQGKASGCREQAVVFVSMRVPGRRQNSLAGHGAEKDGSHPVLVIQIIEIDLEQAAHATDWHGHTRRPGIRKSERKPLGVRGRLSACTDTIIHLHMTRWPRLTWKLQVIHSCCGVSTHARDKGLGYGGGHLSRITQNRW